MSKNRDLVSSPEVKTARSKLDGVLSSFVAQNEEPDNSVDVLGSEELSNDAGKASDTPSKLGARPGKKKRKQMESELEILNSGGVFPQKFFDRVVDLAQFEEETPLYPICRDWFRNDPYKRNRQTRDASPEAKPLPADSEEEVARKPVGPFFSLPPAECPSPEHADRNPRIPSPLPWEDEPSVNTSNSGQLLQQHKRRWRKIRERWRQASLRNERRYQPSLTILERLYTANE